MQLSGLQRIPHIVAGGQGATKFAALSCCPFFSLGYSFLHTRAPGTIQHACSKFKQGGIRKCVAMSDRLMPLQVQPCQLHAYAARSTCPNQKAKSTSTSEHFWSCDVKKVHAVVARSTFWSQNVQSTPFSEHFWKLRCLKSERRCGAKRVWKWKC